MNKSMPLLDDGARFDPTRPSKKSVRGFIAGSVLLPLAAAALAPLGLPPALASGLILGVASGGYSLVKFGVSKISPKFARKWM